MDVAENNQEQQVPAQEPDRDHEENNAAAAVDDQQQASSLPPSQKRVRVSKPDLTIICKSTDDKGEEVERTFECHSIVMAAHSEYFDALLSSTMKESTEKKVTLEKVHPDVFEEAIQLLENPLAANEVSPLQALSVTEFYIRFEFTSGLKLVVSILGKLMDKYTDVSAKPPLPDERMIIIFTIALAEKFSLHSLIEKSKAFLTVKFSQRNASGMGMFDEEDIKRLQPFLASDPGMECLEKYYEYRDVPDILDSNFPKTFTSEIRQLLSHELIRRLKINRIKITFNGISTKQNTRSFVEESKIIPIYEKIYGSGSLFDVGDCDFRNPPGQVWFSVARVESGNYHVIDDLNISYDDEQLYMFDWYVDFTYDDKVYAFIFPGSRNQSLPPLEEGWVLWTGPHSSDLKDPSIKLEYIFGD
jgi:hypothetical protein